MGNAIKFTEAGEIEVAVTVARRDGAETELCVAVRDTGIGIPDDKLVAIFGAFSQADTSTTRKYGGTGLGLAICRHLVGLMGGRLTVSSREGYGSTFSFTARLEAIAEPQRLEAQDLQGRRILVGAVNPAFGAQLADELCGLGLRVEALSEGQAVVDALAASQQDT